MQQESFRTVCIVGNFSAQTTRLKIHPLSANINTRLILSNTNSALTRWQQSTKSIQRIATVSWNQPVLLAARLQYQTKVTQGESKASLLDWFKSGCQNASAAIPPSPPPIGRLFLKTAAQPAQCNSAASGELRAQIKTEVCHPADIHLHCKIWLRFS